MKDWQKSWEEIAWDKIGLRDPAIVYALKLRDTAYMWRNFLGGEEKHRCLFYLGQNYHTLRKEDALVTAQALYQDDNEGFRNAAKQMFAQCDEMVQKFIVSACYMDLRRFRNLFWHKWKLAKKEGKSGG